MYVWNLQSIQERKKKERKKAASVTDFFPPSVWSFILQDKDVEIG